MHLFRNNGAKGETRHLSKRACLDHGKLYIHSGKIAACDEKKLRRNVVTLTLGTERHSL